MAVFLSLFLSIFEKKCQNVEIFGYDATEYIIFLTILTFIIGVISILQFLLCFIFQIITVVTAKIIRGLHNGLVTVVLCIEVIILLLFLSLFQENSIIIAKNGLKQANIDFTQVYLCFFI